MLKIFRYILEITDDQEISIPSGAAYNIIHVAEKHGNLCVWVMVNPNAKEKPVRFLVRGTGHGFTGEEGKHVGSVVMKNGLVWHVFRPIGE
jgi:hypothetical protein